LTKDKNLVKYKSTKYIIFITGEKMSFLNIVKEKSKNLALVYAAIFLPMWIFFLINNIVLHDMLSGLGGIHPRDTSFIGFMEIFTSWMFHGSGNPEIANSTMYAHIMGNSTALIGLLFIIGLIENKPLRLIAALIFGSGFATWLIGDSHSVHIGASGLIFSMFGYVIASVLFGRRWIYLLPIGLMGSQYFYSLKMGLIPQSGVSFAAHFGGFIAGLAIGYAFSKFPKQEDSFTSKQTLKQKWQDKVWDMKYYFKRKFKKV
jgi:membrane associated rhomboid family serine protease